MNLLSEENLKRVKEELLLSYSEDILNFVTKYSTRGSQFRFSYGRVSTFFTCKTLTPHKFHNCWKEHVRCSVKSVQIKSTAKVIGTECILNKHIEANGFITTTSSIVLNAIIKRVTKKIKLQKKTDCHKLNHILIKSLICIDKYGLSFVIVSLHTHHINGVNC